MKNDKITKQKRITTVIFLIALLATILPCDLDVLIAADWPDWRGLNRDGVSGETNWQTSWPESGPKIMWQAAVGTGYSSVTVVDGRLYTMGKINDNVITWCIDTNTGNEIWKHEHPGQPGKYPVPRMTPTVDVDLIFTLTREGQLYALNKVNGAIRWQVNVKNYGALQNENELGFSCSPLVLGDLLILDVGTILAFEKNSGKLTWQSDQNRAGFSSPIAVKFEGVTYVTSFNDYGLTLTNGATGKTFAKHEWKENHQGLKVATPIISAGKIFISSCQNSEKLPTAGLFQIHAKKLVPLVQNSNIGTHITTCVLWQGHLYGFDGMLSHRGALTCLDFETLEVKWTYEGFRTGSVIVVGGKLIILSGKGNLICAEATPAGFKKLAQSKILSGKCWTAPVFVDGRIYCRNYRGKLLCLDVSSKRN